MIDECTQKKLAKVATFLYGFTSLGCKQIIYVYRFYRSHKTKYWLCHWPPPHSHQSISYNSFCTSSQINVDVLDLTSVSHGGWRSPFSSPRIYPNFGTNGQFKRSILRLIMSDSHWAKITSKIFFQDSSKVLDLKSNCNWMCKIYLYTYIFYYFLIPVYDKHFVKIKLLNVDMTHNYQGPLKKMK